MSKISTFQRLLHVSFTAITHLHRQFVPVHPGVINFPFWSGQERMSSGTLAICPVYLGQDAKTGPQNGGGHHFIRCGIPFTAELTRRQCGKLLLLRDLFRCAKQLPGTFLSISVQVCCMERVWRWSAVAWVLQVSTSQSSRSSWQNNSTTTAIIVGSLFQM